MHVAEFSITDLQSLRAVHKICNKRCYVVTREVYRKLYEEDYAEMDKPPIAYEPPRFSGFSARTSKDGNRDIQIIAKGS